MRKNPRQSCTSDRQQGFTMIEMLVTMTVLVAILGIVFSYIGRLQKTYKAEETKVDATQEARTFFDSRSEEHTSELQSQSNLVCRLLLEKKKKKITNQRNGRQ